MALNISTLYNRKYREPFGNNVAKVLAKDHVVKLHLALDAERLREGVGEPAGIYGLAVGAHRRRRHACSGISV